MPIDRWRTLLLGAALLLGSAPAHAVLEGEPFVGLQLLFDDNLFRFSDEAEALATRGDARLNDVREQLRVGAVLQYTWGLQKVVAGAELRRNRYRHAAELDHSAWEAGVTGNWQRGRVWDGELRARYRNELESFEDRDTANRGFQRRRNLGALTRLKLTPRWRSELDLGHEQLRHTLTESRNADRDETRASLGLTYEIQRFTRFGASLKWLRGEFPARAPDPAGEVAQAYQDTGVALVFERVPSGLSTLRGELGYTARRHERATALDFSGVTGSLAYRREISGRLVSDTELFRELGSVEERDASFRLRTGLGSRLRWRWSPKLESLLGVEWSRSTYRGAPTIAVGTEQREDELRKLEAGIDYRALWWLMLHADVAWEQRDSNREDRRYEDRRITLSAEARYD